jgi:hypothetical protein
MNRAPISSAAGLRGGGTVRDVTDQPQASPDLPWATHAEPDFLVLRFPPVPVVTGGGAHDAMRALLARRGFRPVAETDDLDLRPANGCLLTRLGATGAELLITIGGRVGASRIPLDGIDEAWLARAVDAGHAAVLAVDSAVRLDGTTSREAIRRDVDAGGGVAALVPVGDGE